MRDEQEKKPEMDFEKAMLEMQKQAQETLQKTEQLMEYHKAQAKELADTVEGLTKKQLRKLDLSPGRLREYENYGVTKVIEVKSERNDTLI